ncbi:MAG: hypothetical protein ACHQQS_03650 [Thermoanaerobaculales bacterium]
MNRKALFGALLAALIVALATPATAQNKIEGSLLVGGKPIKLTHVYAYATEGFFDPKKQDVVVVMADAEVAPAVLRDHFALADLAKAGKLHYVQQTINTEGQVINFEVRHELFKMPETGGSSEQVFEPKTFDKKLIAGRSRTVSPQKSFDGIQYSYDLTFTAKIEPMK